MGRYEHECLHGVYSSGGDRQLIEGVKSMAEARTMTIVLVHGAFAESLSNWKPVLELLLAKGYKVVAAPNPLRGVSSDAAYVSSILNTIDGPIILVGHSYGGAVITNAVNGNQSVKALVYVAAFAPDTGESVATLLRRFPGSTVEANTAAPILLADGSRDLYFQPDKFRAQYAADLPETETKLLALTQRPMAERAMTEASDVAAWKAIPSWFIFGTRDNSIPVNLLAFMAERAGSKKTVTIEGASHAVMMSHADAVVELVEQAAWAVGGDGVTEANGGGNEQVHGGDVRCVVTQEGGPALGRRSTSLDHVLRHAGLSDLEAELEQLAMNARRTP
jgi:pimeloyl-ACP methyl ester carboxylesterase